MRLPGRRSAAPTCGASSWRASSVDVVLCHQVLHHVPDQRAVLAELHRVLRPDGVLLVAESCRAFVRSLPVRLLFRHPPNVQHGAAGYLALLRESGFDFDREATSTPDPFWARPDFGLRERLGLRARRGRRRRRSRWWRARPLHRTPVQAVG